MITEDIIKKISEKLELKVITFKELGNGEHNINYKLITQNEPLVLRIYANKQFDHANKEYEILKKINGSIAPKIYFKDFSKEILPYNYIIQEFIEGETLKTFNKEDLIKLAKIIKQVHSIKSKHSKKSKYDISDWNKNILSTSINSLSKESKKEVQRAHDFVDNLFNITREFAKSYSSNSLTHDDLIFDNIIKKPDGSLFLIDWEFASYDYFFMDFGSLFSENSLSENKRKIFLQEYGFGSDEKEALIVKTMNAYRELACMSWNIERIHMIKNEKKVFEHENITTYENLLKNHLKKIKAIQNNN